MEQPEQDSKDEADAECARIATQKEAAKEEYNEKISGLTEAVPPGPQAQGKALRDLRVQELQKRVEQAARELRAATEGDPELVALEQRLGQLAAEEKKKPDKHFSSLAWRKVCVALVVIFQFGVKKTARKMAQLLDDEGAPSSWEKQVEALTLTTSVLSTELYSYIMLVCNETRTRQQQEHLYCRLKSV
jgi:hypothetical protein